MTIIASFDSSDFEQNQYGFESLYFSVTMAYVLSPDAPCPWPLRGRGAAADPPGGDGGPARHHCRGGPPPARAPEGVHMAHDSRDRGSREHSGTKEG